MEAIKNLIGKKVIVRSYGAGVFFGTLNEFERCEDKYTVELLDCRRLWQWAGAWRNLLLTEQKSLPNAALQSPKKAL